MTERDARGGRTGTSPGATEQQRARNARSFFALLVCVLGLLLAVGAGVATLFSGARVDVVSAGAVGVGLGIVGYALDAGRLAVATIAISILALFFGLAVNQVIPGVGGDDRELPDVEPRAAE